MKLFSKGSDSIAVMIHPDRKPLELRPSCPIVLENLAGSKVRLALSGGRVAAECPTITCEIEAPETKDIIRKNLAIESPRSYQLRSGQEAQSLEALVYDVRIEMNGYL